MSPSLGDRSTAVEAMARLAREPRCSDWGERLTDARLRALLDAAYPAVADLEADRDRLRAALREVYAVTVHVEDAVDAATRASHIAQEALDA